MVSPRYREKVQKHFEIPHEIPKIFETFQEFLSSNWHNWSNLHALPTAICRPINVFRGRIPGGGKNCFRGTSAEGMLGNGFRKSNTKLF
jgi:hypothetical protein